MDIKEIVAVESCDPSYPKKPFNPPTIYPEFENFETDIDPTNNVYGAVRNVLQNLELDKDNFNKKSWNPFKELINEKSNIVIKPNLVFDDHPLGKEGVLSMITHASIIRPIIDYIILTNKNCNITICDVPLQSANWKKIIENNGLKDLVEYYKKKNIEISLLDLRYEVAVRNKEGFYYKKIKKAKDPKGYVTVNLGKNSYIQDIIKDYKKLEITDYGLGTVSKHHNPNKNEYLIPKTILEADFFINIPKLKTHRKAGVTLSLKNLIGINGDKSWIAHHRRGIDEYPELYIKEYLKWRINYYMKIYAPKWFNTFIRKIYRILFLKGKTLKEHSMKTGGTVMEGNWYGNDTIWRTILDLNNIIFFADKEGKMHKNQQRKYLSIIDGVIGMEKEGPMDGYPKKSGIIVGGFHPVATDYVATKLMGFDYKKIPQIKQGLQEKYFGLTNFTKTNITVNSNINWEKLNLKFIASKGWKGHCEIHTKKDNN